MPVGIRCQVDHPGQLLRATAAVLDRLGADVVPDMLVNTQDRDALEPGRVVGRCLQQWPDRFPHGAPPRAPPGAELPADPVDTGVLTSDLSDRPPTRTSGQLAPWRRNPVVLFDEHRAGTGRFQASPASLTPPHPDRSPETGCVDQGHHVPAAPGRSLEISSAVDTDTR